MLPYKEIFGYGAVLIGTIGYIPYIKDILAKRTKPHLFSWLIWFLTEAIAFTVQWFEHGGAGGWVHGMQAGLCLVVVLLAIWYGHRAITRFDWWSLGLAVLGIVLWWWTNQALLAVLLSIVVDVLAFAPTFRKSYRLPQQETARLYVTSGLSYGLALFALGQYAVVNWLYQAVLVGLNFSMVLWLLILRRRAKIKD